MKELLEQYWRGNLISPLHIILWVKSDNDLPRCVRGRRVEFSKKWKERQQRRIRRTQRKR